MKDFMLKIRTRMYELRFKYYMRLNKMYKDKARKHLFDDDLRKYKKYMNRVRDCLWEIQNITMDAEENNINMKVWPSR